MAKTLRDEVTRVCVGGRGALLIGNGINLFAHPKDRERYEWLGLLRTIAQRKKVEVRGLTTGDKPDVARLAGVSYPELFDLIVGLSSHSADSFRTLVAQTLASWQPRDVHRGVVERARVLGAPILTTNFDLLFQKAVGLDGKRHRHRTRSGRSAGIYPWHTYFADRAADDPTKAGTIWHVHGFALFRRSIRLGLFDYAAALERARAWVGERTLWTAGSTPKWTGHQSWIDIFMHRGLVIAGLTYSEQEILLRWLLLARAAYHRRKGTKPPRALFLRRAKDPPTDGQETFFRYCGVRLVGLSDYRALYGALT